MQMSTGAPPDENDCLEVRCAGGQAARVPRSSLIDAHEASRLAELFRLLGDPTRARLLGALMACEELCVCDLAAAAEVPESTVSGALRLLRTAGVVRNRRSGRMIYYSLDDSHVRLLLEVSLEHLRHDPGGDRR